MYYFSVCRAKIPAHEEMKYIVFHSQLMELFQICPNCTAPTTGDLIRLNGTAIHIQHYCPSCKYSRVWSSQPYKNSMAMGNIVLSACILFSGMACSKAIRFFNALHIPVFHRSTYYRHQSDYLEPAIYKQWQLDQKSLVRALKKKPKGLILAGDGRSDSPGHCAKYGTYSVLEQQINKVVDVQVVQVKILF